jgi:uncharacterized damage-inducible protein DinB
MDKHKTLGQMYLKELLAEAPASRKCLERVPEKLFDYKPHEKSMNMGYLALLVADIPRWISHMIEKGDIDFATFKQNHPKTTKDLLALFDENMKMVKPLMEKVTDEELAKTFSLKNNGQVLFSSPKEDNISSSINHLVHHRGQLTVYLRLNNIDVPSIYGPSADDKSF